MKVLGFATMVPEAREIDFTALEKCCGIHFTEHDKEDLLHAINEALVDREIFNNAPLVTEVKERLKNIEEHARELANNFSDSSELGQASLNLCWPWESETDPTAFRHFLYKIAARAKDAKSLGTKKGRPPKAKAYLDAFIPRVTIIYDRAGGSKTSCHWDEYSSEYKGELLELVCCLLSQGGLEPIRNTIAQMIIRYRRQQSVK